jgi:1-pyrroline-5-carboxylate dehydrogenase
MGEVEKRLKADLATVKMGSPEDFSCFFNAVIHERSFDKIVNYIEQAKANPLNRIIAGGNYDKSKGYFVEPTVIVTQDPMYLTMCEEIFGPVLTIYEYGEDWFEEALILVEQTSPYGLTGAIFAQDRYAIELACKALRNTAGNFYINDKPTGAVVGQQPFGGARSSGTNDKAGAMFNLLRWVSPQTIKETFLPPTDYRYPFLES